MYLSSESRYRLKKTKVQIKKTNSMYDCLFAIILAMSDHDHFLFLYFLMFSQSYILYLFIYLFIFSSAQPPYQAGKKYGANSNSRPVKDRQNLPVKWLTLKKKKQTCFINSLTLRSC